MADNEELVTENETTEGATGATEETTNAENQSITLKQLRDATGRVAENLAAVADVATEALEMAGAGANIFMGADDTSPGTSGLVPQPQAGDDNKFLRGDGYWGTPTSSGGSNYRQVTKTNISSIPYDIDIVLPYSTSFLYKPPVVLKFAEGDTAQVVTACSFDNGDAEDFTFNDKFVEFDGTMKLKTKYNLNMNTPTALGDGYLSISDEVDMSDFKSVEELATGGGAVGIELVAIGGGKGRWSVFRESGQCLLLSSSDAAYDFDGNLIALNWQNLSDTEKAQAFDSATGDAPSTIMSALGTFRLMVLSSDNSEPDCVLTAIPNDQLIVPQGLISIFEDIKSVTVTKTTDGSATLKMAVTPDLTNYYAYDANNSSWVAVAKTAAGIIANGMTSAELAAIPQTAWKTLLSMTQAGAVGFAYALSMTSASENCYVDEISIIADMKGSWQIAANGVDYTCKYNSNTNIRVTILSAGTWKINYDAG